MSKITREEYLRKRIVDAYETRAYTDLLPSIHGGYNPNKGWENWEDELKEIEQLINQQPQLSDDVEEFFDDIYELAIQVDYEYEDGKDYSDKMKVKLAIIKQHIQEQASEIEGQKAITKEVSDTAMETIHEMNNKLNAIREVGVMSGLDSLTRSGAILILKAIKQILKENNNEEHIK